MRAWIWLICKACWKPTKFDVHGSTITLERGQLCASIRQIADDLKWSKSAVERFLTRLETETMIERKAGQGRSIITICNYGKYQDVQSGKRDSSGTATETAAGQQRDIKEPSNQVTNKPEPKGSRRASALPSDWEPKLTERSQGIVSGWPRGMLEVEIEKFRDHASDKGRTSKDWQAAFRKWIDNAEAWRPKNDKPTTRQIGERLAASYEGGNDCLPNGLPLIGAARGT